MSSNVGLATPRGSGTSGYVQRSLSHLKARDGPYNNELRQPDKPHVQRQPDAAILEHDRRRRIEVSVFALRDKLEEQGRDEDDIDAECDALRAKLTAESDRAGAPKQSGARLKSHQVHEIARAKIQEDEKLRRALGISGDYEEGGHWKRQEERKRGVAGSASEAAGAARDVRSETRRAEVKREYRDRDVPARRDSRSRSPVRRDRSGSPRGRRSVSSASYSSYSSRSRSRSRSRSVKRDAGRDRPRRRSYSRGERSDSRG